MYYVRFKLVMKQNKTFLVKVNLIIHYSVGDADLFFIVEGTYFKANMNKGKHGMILLAQFAS